MNFKADNPEKMIEYMRENKSKEDLIKNSLIDSYTPFIISQISKITGRYVEIENDELLSIGLLAFDEALKRYDENKNSSFINYAGLVIGSRIKDKLKSKKDKLKCVSLDSIIEEEQEPFKNTYQNDSENIALEIQTWETEINKFGFDLEMLVDEAPKHKDTRLKAIGLSEEISKDDEIVGIMYKTFKFPLGRVVLRFRTTRKIIKRSRKFIIAVIIIFIKKLTFLQSWIFDIKGGVGRALSRSNSENQ